MDGIEWRRDKWRPHEKAWLWLNERAGCWFGDHLIADHPKIAEHLASRAPVAKITTIPYGAERIVDADPEPLRAHGLSPGGYALVIARPEPENSILEIVKAFSRRRRGQLLAVLGDYRPASSPYHAEVIKAASDEVRFLGAIYDRTIVDALRYHARLYIHGHTVGGTNPSLVEALGAGSAVLAHDNRFNRWVAGAGACYFHDEDDCARQLDQLLNASAPLDDMREASRRRHADEFSWAHVLSAYEQLLDRWAVAGDAST
jgi:glycosyltransferase involved in cell wall biosynthesis